MAKIRVLIADDHGILRAGLRMLINAQPDMEVVGQATSNHEVLREARATTPDVILLDLTLADGSSLRIITPLREACPEARVLVLTVHDDAAYVRAALAAGALGYVAKSAADTELMSAIRAVSQNRMFVDCDLRAATGRVLVDPAPAPAAHPHPALTGREQEVLVLLAQGHTNQQAADRLFLSVKTVETYRSRIAGKLGLRTRADLVRYAIEMGLLGPDPLPVSGNP